MTLKKGSFLILSEQTNKYLNEQLKCKNTPLISLIWAFEKELFDELFVRFSTKWNLEWQKSKNIKEKKLIKEKKRNGWYKTVIIWADEIW